MRLFTVIAAALALVGLSPGPALPASRPRSRAVVAVAVVQRDVQPAPPAAQVVATAPVAGDVTRPFQPPPTRYGAGHRGVDLVAEPGAPVVAALGGVVSFSGRVAGVGWVTVDHGGGLNTTYGALSPRVAVAGQHVARGELLGFLAAERGHLDWGARLEGDYIDPLTLLGRWETFLTTLDVPTPALLAAASTVLSGAQQHGPGRLLRPAPGPTTSGFGPRSHPVTGRSRPHAGLDIGAPRGTPVSAAAAGAVTFAGSASGYGTTVILDHGGGLTTLYAHLSALRVTQGQRVAAGGVVGAVGSTGLSTGPHLHFEVRVDGQARDPVPWLER